jgi:hypothetical protein
MPRPSLPSVQAGLNVHTGIPIVYPRLGFLETLLSSKFNPIVTLGKSRLKGFTNKFNGDVELLDDLVFISFPPCLGFFDLHFFQRMTIGHPNTTWYFSLHYTAIFGSWALF